MRPEAAWGLAIRAGLGARVLLLQVVGAYGCLEVEMRTSVLIAISSSLGFFAVCAGCVLLQLLETDLIFRAVLFVLGTLGLIAGFVYSAAVALSANKGIRRWFAVSGLGVALIASWVLSVNFMMMIGGMLGLKE